MRKALSVASVALVGYEVYLIWHLLGATGAALLKTQGLQEIVISSGGYATDDQWREMQVGWIDAGLTFATVLAVPVVFLLVIWIRSKYKRS